MGRMGEKFTEQQAKDFEDRGVNRSDELADLLTITEMNDIISALSLATRTKDYWVSEPNMLALRNVMLEARAIAERNEYAGDYDYPEDAS